MPVRLPTHLRDALVREFRETCYQKLGYIEFPHQARWRLATEGYRLTDVPAGDAIPPGYRVVTVQDTAPSEVPSLENIRIHRRLAVPLPSGPVHHAALLAAYKSGKSDVMGNWAAGFAAVPMAKVQLIGVEYKTAEQEFQYLVEALLSARGMNLRKRHLYFDVRNGRMSLELTNGMIYEVKSWERKDALKGHQITAILACEAYQLPGLESFTSISQNLRAERGYYVWGSTCDSPWLGALHDLGHGDDPDWICVCGAAGWLNPFTFDLRAFLRDCPDLRLLTPYLSAYPWLRWIRPEQCKGLMTRERFSIAWLGQLGTFAGRVYSYVRGSCQFSPESHPDLFQEVA